MTDLASSTGVLGANSHAHELAKRRVNRKATPATPDTPSTPATPIVPSPPVLGHYFYREDHVLEDLQLAAELGKTLLERNRELENQLKQQQIISDDRLQEIEYLSKQTAALREVNDSRLRIYEQLEISIHDLEKTNQILVAENSAHKKKIRSLVTTVEAHEQRIEELQRFLDEAKTSELAQGPRGRTRLRNQLEDQTARRSVSCEHTGQLTDDRASEEDEWMAKLEEKEGRAKQLQNKLDSETKKRVELENEMGCMAQEIGLLQNQLEVLRDRDVNVKSFDDEVASLDDSTSSRLCRKCLGLVETESTPTVQDFSEDIEDMDVNIHGECALIKLKNGGYAWGSQESLASMGKVVLQSSCGTSPGAEELPSNSLLSELDTQYRILIDKYEAMLQAREQQHKEQHDHLQKTLEEKQRLNEISSLVVHPGVDVISGPMSLVMTDASSDPQEHLYMKCQRCSTCTCDLKPSETGVKNRMEEFSEAETSSSGFSEGEGRLSSRSTQTEEGINFPEVVRTPTPCFVARCLDLTSPINPCDHRFQATPEYKHLFHEIFTVLKESLEAKESLQQLAMFACEPCCNFFDANCKDFIGQLKQKKEQPAANEPVLQTHKVNEDTTGLEHTTTVEECCKAADTEISIPGRLTESKTSRPGSLDLSRHVALISLSQQRRRKRRSRSKASVSQCTIQDQAASQCAPSKAADEAVIPDKADVGATTSPAGLLPKKCTHKKRHRNKSSQDKRSNDAKSNTENKTAGASRPEHKSWPFNQMSCPSVEVAKLRRLEATYAEVLKAMPPRPSCKRFQT